MAISYPVLFPTVKNTNAVTFRAQNAVATDRSPFTFRGQTFAYPGMMWRADVNLPRLVDRVEAETWISFLLSLYGQRGTFRMGGDPVRTTPRGTISVATLTGSAGSTSATVTMTGSLLAGDLIQLGTGVNARLHKVVQNQTGNGTLEIWPALRQDYTAQSVVFTSPYGIWRLSDNNTEWSLDVAMTYGISFNCEEAL